MFLRPSFPTVRPSRCISRTPFRSCQSQPQGTSTSKNVWRELGETFFCHEAVRELLEVPTLVGGL